MCNVQNILDMAIIKIDNKLSVQAYFCNIDISNMNCCLFFVCFGLDGQSLMILGNDTKIKISFISM